MLKTTIDSFKLRLSSLKYGINRWALPISSRISSATSTHSSSLSPSSTLTYSNHKPLRVLFFANAHNGLSQRAKSLLESKGHKVDVELAISQASMLTAVAKLNPDLILCPMLTSRVPEEIWRNERVPCVIVHPGVQGDRGMSSIDWAMADDKPFGVTCLSAVEEMDAGPVWATRRVHILRDDPDNNLTKSSIYKHEITNAAMDAILETVHKFNNGIPPTDVSHNDPNTLGTLLPTMGDEIRAVSFEEHDAANVARRIQISDGQPGAPCNIDGKSYYAFGACQEQSFADGLLKHLSKDARPGIVLGYRDGAIAVACKDQSVVWIRKLRAGTRGIKLDAVDALPAALSSSLPRVPSPLTDFQLDSGNDYSNRKWWKSPIGTLNETFTSTLDGICYVNFDIYNGAMDTAQCNRLRQAIARARHNPDVRAIVLTGGYDTFSNGISLSKIHTAHNCELESWRNINAINDVVLEVMAAVDKITVSALRGSAGAGGAMAALAADKVWAHQGVVLNPHYRTMGLHGSEYWTHTLPKRVGSDVANQLVTVCPALSAFDAESIGLVDAVLASDVESFQHTLHEHVMDYVHSTDAHNTMQHKQQAWNNGLPERLEHTRRHELSVMRHNFQSKEYKAARARFLSKAKPLVTPLHYTSRRAQKMGGTKHAHKTKQALAKDVAAFRARYNVQRPPKLCIVMVGNRADSKMYVDNKVRCCHMVGVDVEVAHFDPEGTGNVTLQEVHTKIQQYNQDENIDAVVVQVPTVGLNADDVIAAIEPKKDADGLTPANFHYLTSSTDSPYLPAAPKAILKMLLDHGVQIKAKRAVVIGTSLNLGLPTAMLLEKEGAMVTMVNINTDPDRLRHVLQDADILVSAAGVPHLVKPDMLRDGVVIVDAGISFDASGKLFGDVDTECMTKASLMTPVPGGVGPVTVAALLENVCMIYKQRCQQPMAKTAEDNQRVLAV